MREDGLSEHTAVHTSQPRMRGNIPLRASAPHTDVSTWDEGSDDDRIYPTRLPTSTRRYTSSQHAVTKQGKRDVVIYEGAYYYKGLPQQPQRRSRASAPPPTAQQQAHQTQRQVHWVVYVGVGMCVMLLGWVVLSSLAGWWHTELDTLHYGMPRTFQCDAVVGHHDSAAHPTHFIALNLNGRISVIELPGGDETKAKIYAIATLEGTDQALAPVTLSFGDLSADGKPDMVVHVGINSFIFINDNGQFRPLRPGDQIVQPG